MEPCPHPHQPTTDAVRDAVEEKRRRVAAITTLSQREKERRTRPNRPSWDKTTAGKHAFSHCAICPIRQGTGHAPAGSVISQPLPLNYRHACVHLLPTAPPSTSHNSRHAKVARRYNLLFRRPPLDRSCNGESAGRRVNIFVLARSRGIRE